MNPSEQEKFQCPYCGSENYLDIDTYFDSCQNFVQDCEVCCNPIAIEAVIRAGEILDLKIRRENE